MKGLSQVWGPGLAALVVFYLFPKARTKTVSFLGSSGARSACFCLTPILFAFIGLAIQSGRLSYKIVYYLLMGGFSTLGEELGWRGFLQSALRPLGRVRGYLLLALLWEVWHFTAHTKGTLPQVMSRLEMIVPAVIVITFVLAFVTERTGSLVLAVTLHEWIDIAVDGGTGYLLWAALASVPVWTWLVWTWPKRIGESAERALDSKAASISAAML
jgi:membrane protease YdiL (CAAX protease family)